MRHLVEQKGGLVAIALFSLFKNPGIAIAGAVIITGILVFAQNRRWVEGNDLWIIPAITFVVVTFIPIFNAQLGLQLIVLYSLISGLIAIAVTSLFRLIYQFLSEIL